MALRNIGKPEQLTQFERDARLKFREAFMPALADLGAAEVDPFHVLSTQRKAHDLAIAEYQCQITDSLKTGFKDAALRFRAVRDGTTPGIIGFYQLQVTGSVLGAKAEEIIAAIEQLLSFTES